jgi:hypothetical protein
MKALKTILCTILAATGLFAAAAATSTDAHAGYGSSFSTCAAQVPCGYYAADMFGRPMFVQTHSISCFVSANAMGGTACTWEAMINGYVRCTGIDEFGNWSQLYFTCH